MEAGELGGEGGMSVQRRGSGSVERQIERARISSWIIWRGGLRGVEMEVGE